MMHLQSNNKYFEIAERQLGSKQDIIVKYEGLTDNEGNVFDGMFMADGHGTDDIYIKIKMHEETNQLRDFMCSANPMFHLNKSLNAKRIYKSSGATGIFVRIYSDKIKVQSVGDSRVAIFINGKMKYINCPHNMSNVKEVERLDGQVVLEPTTNPVPVISTKTKVVAKKGVYIRFGKDTRLALSQALGHNGITGIEPENYELTYEPTDTVRVIVGSDGFWDQIILEGPCLEDCEEDMSDLQNMTAEQLADKTEARWKQLWDYYYNPDNLEEVIKDIENDIYDDLCVGVWSKNGLAKVEDESGAKVEEESGAKDPDNFNEEELAKFKDELKEELVQLESSILTYSEDDLDRIKIIKRYISNIENGVEYDLPELIQYELVETDTEYLVESEDKTV
jgi:serine/threonine protein phosphatase PrpC